jgi:rhodanese-related sulfurtransferase
MQHSQVPAVAVDQLPASLPERLTVVDVREQVEWVNGHIEGAHHIPLRELPGRMHELPDGRLLVVCRVGARSGQATRYLQANGHDAVNLAGGMLDWADAGRPMVSELGSPPRVV